MTKKIYYKDPYTKNFTAKVLEIGKNEEDTFVILDKTAFYPEGGGQPSDLGTIGSFEVYDVQKNEDLIYHYIKIEEEQPILNESYDCELDWDNRFDQMQQHAGQHIISAVIERLYDGDTVGFHIGKDYATVDINKALTAENISIIENRTNQIINDNLKIKSYFPSEKELSKIDFRKPPIVSTGVRIVEVDDYDYCPCGGIHPNSTGEIGLLKIRKVEKQKSGVRIDFVCGFRAVNDYNNKVNIVNKLTQVLSVRDFELVSFTEKFLLELSDLKKESKILEKELLEYKSKELLNDFILISENKYSQINFENTPMNDLRQLVQGITSEDDRIVLATATCDDKLSIILAKSKNIPDLHMGNIFKSNITTLGGRGGGNEFVAQGGLAGVEDDKLEEFKSAIKNSLH